MKNLYIAGSLFNEAEATQRIKEGNCIYYEQWRCFKNGKFKRCYRNK